MSRPARGILLQRTLDERSPSRRFDARALQQEISELERTVAPSRLVTATRRRGHLIDVAVLAAKPAQPREKGSHGTAKRTSVSAWRPDPW